MDAAAMRAENAAWIWPRFKVAFDMEIRPAFLRALREYHERTGERDMLAGVEWEGVDPTDCALVFRMESGEVHRIPFALIGKEH